MVDTANRISAAAFNRFLLLDLRVTRTEKPSITEVRCPNWKKDPHSHRIDVFII